MSDCKAMVVYKPRALGPSLFAKLSDDEMQDIVDRVVADAWREGFINVNAGGRELHVGIDLARPGGDQGTVVIVEHTAAGMVLLRHIPITDLFKAASESRDPELFAVADRLYIGESGIFDGVVIKNLNAITDAIVSCRAEKRPTHLSDESWRRSGKRRGRVR